MDVSVKGFVHHRVSKALALLLVILAEVKHKLVLGSLYAGYVLKADHSPLLVQTSRQ